MKNIIKNSPVIAVILILIGSALTPILVVANDTSIEDKSDTQKELSLLRVEHYLYVEASENVSESHIRFSFPPIYSYQIPILLEIFNDSTASILHYQIEDDAREPNKVVNFTIGSIEKDERVLIHFTCWVLVENHDFTDLPNYVKIPTRCELPEETKKWLASTEVVQADSLLIKLKAMQLRGLSDNLIRFAGRIAPYIKWHRYLLFVIELNLPIFFSQDAITTLLINGENVGRSHLACAFLRSNDVPARVLLAHNDQGFWTQMHYMIEYYCPGYGWVLIDPTKGETPYETKRQVINRVCYPEDENDTKTDYIHSFMTGEERWLWIDNENIYPYYVDCDEGSKSQMFTEANLLTEEETANYAQNITKNVFIEYQSYLGLNLTGDNLSHFIKATIYQKNATHELQNSDIQGYIDNMNLSYDEYSSIIL